jgi:hypothetical protein
VSWRRNRTTRHTPLLVVGDAADSRDDAAAGCARPLAARTDLQVTSVSGTRDGLATPADIEASTEADAQDQIVTATKPPA